MDVGVMGEGQETTDPCPVKVLLHEADPRR